MSGGKFSPDSLYATSGVLEALRASGDDILTYLVKHLAGDSDIRPVLIGSSLVRKPCAGHRLHELKVFLKFGRVKTIFL